ncbi:MDR family MFS transporter [Lederbergia lenta]|uniref:Efflux transporter n=1 Tax=Lederbergia lenta TaxID=1467 RepID=A0A2X4W985_LEDLE|nr:MDR family MFS transporter [Lederbergia lenta]MEC2324985.1 MDR family MFS transporter [Lederbergia lenta]SQI56518.1 efflux transporter [Lederbergia lenta]
MISEKQSFNRNLIIGILLSASFVTILNQTLIIIAIPPIMSDFQINPSQAQWLTTAFMLTNGILIPVTAFFIERFSSKHLLVAALSIFSLGTLVGAIAPSFSMLLLARIVQAVGAGIMMPLMQTVMLTLFPPEKRGSAMGLVGLVTGFAPAIGPTLAGWLIIHFSWRSLFYTVLPVSLIVLLLAIFLMKNVTEQKQIKIDLISIVFSTFGWGGLLYGFSIAGTAGWTSAQVIGTISVGAVALFIFILRQLKLKQPMLEFRVFNSPMFAVTTILSVLVFATMVGTQTLLPIYAQDIASFTALESGLMLLPGALIMGFMSPVTGRVFDRFGGKWLSVSGFSIITVSLILYANLSLDTSIVWIATIFFIMMIGISMMMMPLMTAGINALPRHLIPHGTAMSNTIRMVGGSIGTAILVSVMSNASLNTSLQQPKQAAMVGIQDAFMIASIVGILGILLSFRVKKQETINREKGKILNE